MNLGGLFVSLGLKTDLKELNKFNTGLDKAPKLMKSATVAITAMSAATLAAGYSFKKFSDSGIQSAKNLQTFTNQTGLAVTKLNQLANVGKSIDLNLNENNITTGILGLEKTLARLRLGQGNFAPFQMAGIDVLGKDAFDVIKQLRQQVKGLDDITATVLIEDIGLDANFLSILKLSNKEFDKLSKNSFLNGKEAKTLNNLGLQVRKISTEFINLRNKALVKLAPYLKDLVDKSLKWFKDNGDRVVNTISSLAKGFGMFAEAIGRAASLILNAKGSILLLAGAVGLLAVPFIPVIAGLTAIVLLLDDIAVWKANGKSMFGPLYDAIAKIPNLYEVLGIGLVLLAIPKLAKGLTSMVAIGGKSVKALSKIKPSVAAIGGKLVKALSKIKPSAAGLVITGFSELVSDDLKDITPDKANPYIDTLKYAAQGGGLGSIFGPLGAGLGALGGLGYGAYKNFYDGGSNSTTTNNDINITVNANSSEPNIIAREVENVLQNQFTQAQTNISFQK